MSTLTASVDHDFTTGMTYLRCHGDLDVRGAARLRTAALKRLADHPLILIINLSEARVVDELAILVFPALNDHAEPATHLVLCADPASTSGALLHRRLDGWVQMCPTEEEAVSTAKEWPSPSRVHAHLGPDEDAPGLARQLVVRFCQSWKLSSLTDHAQLIVSELVSNSVRHARTDIELTVTLGKAYLHLQVRDRSTGLPTLYLGPPSLRARQSRGLILVDSLASGWGTRISGYGKTVWATLRFAPLTISL